MARPGIKLDDGSGGFATNCFPVRTLVAQTDEAYGAWFVAHKAEQRRRFKAYVCSKPRTYEEIRGERKRAEKDGTAIIPPAAETNEDDGEEDGRILDGFFLMKHCCVDDPTDLCSVNISGQGLADVKEEDFTLFDNVAYVNASENVLPFEAFHNFNILRELEMSLNGLRSLKIKPTDFPHLEMLDLSFNNLSCADILSLALLPKLKVLHLTGNSLRTLPPDMARPHLDESTFDKVPRFRNLEILLLDDNKLSDLSVFAALAGLRQLRHLNLAKNGIKSVPQLMLVEGKHITQDDDKFKKPTSRSGRKSRTSSRKSNRSSPGKLASISNIPEKREKTASIPSSPEKQAGKELAENKEFVQTDSDKLLEDTAEETNPSDPIPEGSGPSKTKVSDDDLTARISLGADLDMLSELKLEDLNLGELNTTLMESLTSVKPGTSGTKLSETGAQAGDAFERDGYTGDVPLPPPFPALRHLNLAHNNISEEEGLLAVAAWPMLSELILHDNPLTTQISGDPPLLKRFLTDRLGINICRKRPDPLSKPHIEVPVKPDRKVNLKILPVPRCDVNKLLAIEAPKLSEERVTTPSTAAGDQQQPLDASKPLPPIPSTPGPEDQGKAQSSGNAFFMTQIDEPSAPQPRATGSRNTARTPQSTGRRKQKPQPQPQPQPQVVNEKYKGYEALLDIDDEATEGNSCLPKDLPSNIRALQYALTHPLVFRGNPSDLQVPQPPYRPYVKGHKTPSQKPRKTKAEKIDETLSHLKNRSTVIEEDLKTVLDSEKQTEFGDANKLLGQVQRRYNAVRASSMKKTRDIVQTQNALRETLKDTDRKLGKASVRA